MRCVRADLLEWEPDRRYELWHDRAVFHFLVEERDADRYIATLNDALAPGGHVIVATFADDGPEMCSGLPVRRYAAEDLAAALGEGFELVETRRGARHPAWDAAAVHLGRGAAGLGKPAFAVPHRLTLPVALADGGVRLVRDGRLLLDTGTVAKGDLVDRVAPPVGAVLVLPRADGDDDAGPVPAPTIVCLALGGQCTKSHCRSGRSSPSMIRSASPATTRKSSWSASQ